MAVGVIIMAFGFLVMSEAALEFERNGSSAMYYLVIAYLLHTIGELCTSPTVMALITKLAPLKYASLLMGTYFACTGFGNKLAASLGKWAQTAGEYQIFLGIFIFCSLFGFLVILIIKPLKRLTHGLD
jgi:POT family proton-dependent oligopeptide transporter